MEGGALILESERVLAFVNKHEHNDEMRGPGPGSGPGPGQKRPEGEESQPPSAKAYKVGEEEDGELVNMGAHEGCVRMDGWMPSQRGGGVSRRDGLLAGDRGGGEISRVGWAVETGQTDTRQAVSRTVG